MEYGEDICGMGSQFVVEGVADFGGVREDRKWASVEGEGVLEC